MWSCHVDTVAADRRLAQGRWFGPTVSWHAITDKTSTWTEICTDYQSTWKAHFELHVCIDVAKPSTLLSLGSNRRA